MSAPIRIVLADDHPIFRRGLREVLEAEADLQVVAECGDGEEALAAIERERPTVALLDVGMPKQDGLAVVRALRDRGSTAAVVLLTMHARDDLLREAFSLGVRGYVVKEAAVLDVVHALREVVAGRPFISSSLSATLLTGAGAKDAGVPPEWRQLTPAEMRVLRLIAEFKSSKEIAEELGVHYRTVENQRSSIAAKLGLAGSHALSRYAALHRERLK
ncbi:MAG TPA: response regulator transcription factor [Candidatus Bathyarchaeia archaeon]|nr:response regulator transcription factor [Candidatus Bathyarchaeia archaeon]